MSRCGARTWWHRLHSLGDTRPGSGQRANEPRSGGHKRNARSGAQRGGLKPPVLGPRASDAGKCPHPGNPRRTAAAAAAATRSGRQNGGGSDGLVLRESQVLATPRRAALAGRSPPACVPALPHPEPRALLGGPGDGLRAAAAPALGPAAAVQKPHCPLQVGPEPAPRVGLTLFGNPCRRGGGRRGPRPSPLAGVQGPLWTGGLGRPGPGLTGLIALT